MDGISCRHAVRYMLPVVFAILAVAALICIMPMISDDSEAASTYSSTYNTVKVDGVTYSISQGVATATGCDFSRITVDIKDYVENEQGKYPVTYCDIFFSNMYMVEHITYGKNVVVINSSNMGSCQYLKTITVRGYDTQINDYERLCEIKTLEAINIDGLNAKYSSSDGVLFDALKQTLLVYPSAKTSTTFEIPILMDAIYADSGIRTNTYLQKITGTSVMYTTQDGILYDLPKERIIVCPAGYSGDKLEIPEGVQNADFPVYTSVKEIVIPSTFTKTEMEWGFAAGILKIPKESLPAAGTTYSIILEETKDVPDAVKNVAGDYRIYRLDIGGQTSYSEPVTMTMYEVKYRASNMHIYNITADGETTDVDVISRAKTGAVVETTLPGYYTYGFNDSSTIENAEIIALVIAVVGTVFAIIAIVRGIGRKP